MKKSSISFGLVNIPINFSPIIKDNDILFNQLHSKCLNKIKYVKYCPHCKKEVKQTDIVKGYEYESDNYITLTKEEFNKLKSEDEKIIEIIGFIDLKEIDPVYFERSYVIFSNTKSKAYSLFKAALNKTKKVAVAKTVIGTKFYYVILRLGENNILMNTLYFEEEVVIPDKIQDVKFTTQELDLAVKLINSLNMDFKPEELVDEYKEKVKKAIDDKIAGKSVKKSPKKQEKSIKDLMTALEMSLKNV